MKSLSDDARQKPSTLSAYSQVHRASMISDASVEFLPRVYANCWIGWIACRFSASFQPVRFWFVQSP